MCHGKNMGVESATCCASSLIILRVVLDAHKLEMKAVTKNTDCVVFCTIAHVGVYRARVYTPVPVSEGVVVSQ